MIGLIVNTRAEMLELEPERGALDPDKFAGAGAGTEASLKLLEEPK